MATTARDICTLAGRKLGLIRAGGELKAADASDMLASLVSFYMESINAGAFGRIRSVLISSETDYDARGGQHINVATEDAVSIDLPATVPACYWDQYQPYGDYGWPLCYDGYSTGVKAPSDRSVVQITDQFGESRPTYIYDRTVQRWMRIDNLNLNDEAPLSARGADGLSSLLATRVVDQFGSELLSHVTIKSANRYQLALVTHHGVDDGCYC